MENCFSSDTSKKTMSETQVPEVVELLRENGPMTRNEMTELRGMPAGSENINPEVRSEYNVRKFAAKTSNTSRLPAANTIYYLADEQDKRDVVRKYLRKNREKIEPLTFNVRSSLQQATGDEWRVPIRRVWREDGMDWLPEEPHELREFDQEPYANDKTCPFCGTDGIKKFPGHLREDCEEVA